MSQIVRGVHLGVPGVYVIAMPGDPSTIQDFGVGVQGAAGFGTIGYSLPVSSLSNGCLFLRTDAPDANHALYVLVNGTWTAK